jgi:hypothetical protein
MRRFLIPVAVLLSVMLLVPSCYGYISGSGNLETRDYDYSDFNRVEVGSAFEVEVVQAASFSVGITADDNIFDYLIISKSDDTLEIRLKSGYSYQSFTVEALIMMPNLTRLQLSGATHGSIQGFSSSNDLFIELSGASSLAMTDIEAGALDFEISGASNVTGDITAGNDAVIDISGASSLDLSGSAEDLRADVSGASHLGLDEFLVHSADVELSGASSGTVNMDGTLNANLSGASTLYYVGQPTMGDIDTSGSSNISKK